MNWTDDTLMAYADGELADPPRGAVERALAADAALRARVEAMQAQRARLSAAFAPVLEEPMPQHLLDLLQPAGAATAAAPAVASLDAHRAARQQANAAATEQARERAAATPRTAAASWARWGGMAAALLLGVMLGTQLDRGGPGIGLRDGKLVAGGPIGEALSAQLAGAPAAGAPVSVQLSFVDKTGRYCRTFSTATLAGLACRDGAQWGVQTLAAADSAAQPTGMRQAASALPRAVLDAVDAQIAGPTLDAAGERAARDAGWRR